MRPVSVLSALLLGFAVVNFAFDNALGGVCALAIGAFLGCLDQARDAYRCAREDREDP